MLCLSDRLYVCELTCPPHASVGFPGVLRFLDNFKKHLEKKKNWKKI